MLHIGGYYDADGLTSNGKETRLIINYPLSWE